MADGATVAAMILAAARQFLGGRYVSGGAAPGGFDCSGLVQYVYGKAGIHLPRVTFDQVNQGLSIDAKHAAPGDLVFFDETGADAPGPGGSPWGHVGIYIGNGQMLDAANPQAGIRIENVAGFSPVGKYQFRRVIPNYAGTGDTGMTTPGASGGLSSLTAASWDTNSVAAAMGLSESLFNSNPELKQIMAQASSEGLDPSTDVGRARFTALLQGTKWYRTKTDQQRKWELLNTSDPAEAKQQFISSLGTVIHGAAAMGVSLTVQQEWALASQNAQFGWTADELKYSIAAHLKLNNTGMYGGDAGTIADTLQKNAQAYGMPLSAIDTGKAVFQILNGNSTVEDHLAKAKTYAMGMFPGIKAQIAAGQTVADAAQPYTQVYQNTLELPATAIDLTKDPSIRKALAYTAPSLANPTAKPGVGPEPPTVMPLWQYEQTLKDDPRWLKTDNAQKSIVDSGVAVLKQMGLSA